MKTNIGLVEHCKMALAEGWGYVYGTFGQVLTEILLQHKLMQYPANVSQYETFIRTHWTGKRVSDCVGLIKSYLWWNGNMPIYRVDTDKSANGMYYAAKEKGDISTLPEIPGVCVWKPGHIGVYIGNGQVIEAKGTKYGVVQTPLTGAGANAWTHWCKCPYIEYEGGANMSWEQRNEEFVKKFQSATGLVVDGKAGEKTFTMFEAVKPLLSDFVNQEDNYPSYEVKQLNGIKYVEIGPLSLGSELVYDNANNLAKKYPNFTGGMFSDGNPNWPTKGRLFCLLAIDGKKIFTPQTYDKKPKGTLVIYNDGNVQVNTVRDLASVAGTKLVIQGFNLDYEKNGSRTMNESILNEGWLSDVCRCTTRSAIGYNPSKKKIIIAHITGTANELRLAMRKLGSVDSDNNTIGIGMDGGSMDALVVNGKVIVNGGGWLRHIITF